MWDTFRRDGQLNENGPDHLLDRSESGDEDPLD